MFTLAASVARVRFELDRLHYLCTVFYYSKLFMVLILLWLMVHHFYKNNMLSLIT